MRRIIGTICSTSNKLQVEPPKIDACLFDGLGQAVISQRNRQRLHRMAPRYSGEQ